MFKSVILEESEDEKEEMPTPRTHGRIANSTVIFGDISNEVLTVWSQLPKSIRLNPSMAVFESENERTRKNLSCSDSELSGLIVEGETDRELYVLNMSLKHRKKSINAKDFKEDEEEKESSINKLASAARYIKLSLLIGCWIIFFFILMVTKDEFKREYNIAIPSYEVETVVIGNNTNNNRVRVTVEGGLLPVSNINKSSNYSLPYSNLSIWLELMPDKGIYIDDRTKNISDVWVLSILPPELAKNFPSQRRINTFDLEFFPEKLSNRVIALKFQSDCNATIPLSLSYNFLPTSTYGITLGACALVGLYVLIIFEIVHQTIAAVLAAVSGLAILAFVNEKPSVSEITSWIDVDTLMLLFSMMIIVAVISDTGLFDFLAVYAYKITGGKIWQLVSTLCFFAAFLSCFLDNVTTIMLMTPVTIRLCEVVQLNPVPVLTSMVIFSNIGGASTPIGDPPNIIIATNKYVIAVGIGFDTFILHMGVGIILVFIVVYGHFRFIFRNLDVLRFKEPQEVQELKHEISIWKKAASGLSSYSSVREMLLKKSKRLSQLLKKKIDDDNNTFINYTATLGELQTKYSIRDKYLLAKSGFCMTLLIFFFFLHSWPKFHLSIGLTAFLCVLLLLILLDKEDLDGIMARVEWNTLLFFAALFVFMEALTKLGLISWIGQKTESIIMSVSEESRLAVAILLILWISALSSALVDNVPLSTMMIRIATELSKNKNLQLPLPPLVWALAFGACFGGNGTLIGSSANVVCAGIAEQHGYHITFMQFFKMGFPILITSTTTATIYLLFAHVVLEWY